MRTDAPRSPALTMADRVAIGFGGILLVLLSLTDDDESPSNPARDLDLAAVGILALALGVLVFRRRRPGTVALVVLGLTSWWYGSGYTSGLINIAPLVAFFALGATGDLRRQLGVGGAAVAFLLLSIVAFGGDSWTSVIDAVGWTLAAILAGELVHGRRLLLEEYALRAQRAEAERDSEAERQVVEERLRIARDLHDVLAHSVALMTVQAGVAADALDLRPEATRAALVTLRSAGRDAMDEVKAMVSVLRRGAGPAGTEPAPRLGQLAGLVETARGSGVDVDLDAELPDRAVTGLVELTVFRVVQEGLTNVLRHARATHAWVRLRRDDDQLLVEIRDDGPGGSAGEAVAGSGLTGMRERVESLGGTLAYGPADGGGWAVLAALPAAGDGAPSASR